MLFSCWACVARASAWLQPEGGGQLIAEVSVSNASHVFGSHMPVHFNKIYLKDAYEYGLSDTLTVFSTPQYAVMKLQSRDYMYTDKSFAFEGGVRTSLYDSDDDGTASLQLTYRRMSISTVTLSSDSASGSEVELRLLYGCSYSLQNFDGFVNAETGWRRTLWPRPNEVVADITTGMRINENWLVMVQSFNTISAGFGSHAYASYRQNKVELSVVRYLNKALAIQLGAYLTPAGQAVIAEQGVSVAIWIDPTARLFGE